MHISDDVLYLILKACAGLRLGLCCVGLLTLGRELGVFILFLQISMIGSEI